MTFAKHTSPEVPFGGIDMIMFGDFLQYPPIMDTPLYFEYGDTESNVKASTSQAAALKQLGRFLWKQLTHVT